MTYIPRPIPNFTSSTTPYTHVTNNRGYYITPYYIRNDTLPPPLSSTRVPLSRAVTPLNGSQPSAEDIAANRMVSQTDFQFYRPYSVGSRNNLTDIYTLDADEMIFPDAPDYTTVSPGNNTGSPDIYLYRDENGQQQVAFPQWELDHMFQHFDQSRTYNMREI